jgi:hypothetical protein
LNRNPFKRLGANGAQEIKSHPFFKGQDWSPYEKTMIDSLDLPYVPEREVMTMGPKKREKAEKDLIKLRDTPAQIKGKVAKLKKMKGWSFARGNK